jgi:hypothetical protein
MLYGQDNPVDGFVLNVILRKAEAIQKELGVLVPMPEDEQRISQALVKAALMRRSDAYQKGRQLGVRLRRGRTVLAPLQAQWPMRWRRPRPTARCSPSAGSSPKRCCPSGRNSSRRWAPRRTCSALCRAPVPSLNAPLETARTRQFRLLPQHLPGGPAVASRGRWHGQADDVVDFSQLHRSNPLVTVLAEHLLEDALQEGRSVAARCAATVTDSVDVVTTVYLLRLRHQLSYVRRRQPHQLMAEETVTLAVRGRSDPQWLSDDSTGALLACEPSANLPGEVVQREIRAAIEFLQAHSPRLEALAEARAAGLLDDHRRVREAARDVGQYSVTPCLPVDVIGVYVLLPDAL